MTRSIYRSSPQAGFSIIELLVTCSVVALLAYLAFPVFANGRMNAKRTACASNMRQIGTAIIAYAADHSGQLPVTSHSTGNSRRKVNGEWVYSIERSWIYSIAEYLSNVDEVRICPAEEDERKERIRDINATSYLLNDVIFDYEETQRLQRIPEPAAAPILFIGNRPISKTWDHAHCGSWSNWQALCADVATDRHRTGSRDPQQLNGSANYLYADGHVKNLSANEMKALLESGATPWIPKN